MRFTIKAFERENTRDKIQTLLDIDIFKKERTPEEILEYLEYPY